MDNINDSSLPEPIKQVLSKIKQRTESLNYTQTYLGKQLGITPNAYCKIENGLVTLTVEDLIIIAATLNSDASFFLV